VNKESKDNNLSLLTGELLKLITNNMKRLKVMTEKEILELRPTFKVNGITFIEWFNITKGCNSYGINSGTFDNNNLIKSKYNYSNITYGDKASKLIRTEFTIWWNNLNNLNK